MKQGHPWLNSCMAWTILQTHDDMKRYPRPLPGPPVPRAIGAIAQYLCTY